MHRCVTVVYLKFSIIISLLRLSGICDEMFEVVQHDCSAKLFVQYPRNINVHYHNHMCALQESAGLKKWLNYQQNYDLSPTVAALLPRFYKKVNQ